MKAKHGIAKNINPSDSPYLEVKLGKEFPSEKQMGFANNETNHLNFILDCSDLGDHIFIAPFLNRPKEIWGYLTGKKTTMARQWEGEPPAGGNGVGWS